MKTILRLGLLGIIVLAMTFAFIHVSRAKEEKLRQEINGLNSLLGPQLKTISELDAQIEELNVKVESITDAKRGHVTRQDMLEIMDYNVESYKLIEERQRAECQKIVYENALRDRQKKMESLRSSFFTRIFLK
jgi:septal ring factor EnvC (AmiA/AmiB activator)